jgi:acetamidase/formamidase
VSGSPHDPVPSEWIPPEIPTIYSEVRDRGPGPHILTGPVFVSGARLGATLQVDILSIEVAAPYGYNKLQPLRGILPDLVQSLDVAAIPIDRASGIASPLPGVTIPVRPFFGVMGVAPPPGWGRISSSAPRSHGGNIDNKELGAGATLFLPIWVEGALFSAGDGHAAQGDGEVDSSALETCLEAEFRLTVRDDFALQLPVATTPSHLITMGFDEDLDDAARVAVRSLVDLLQRYCGLTWQEAYRLASISADLRVTQVVNGVKGAHVMVERDLLAQLGGCLPFV